MKPKKVVVLTVETSVKPLAANVKPGDKVNFTSVQSGTDYLITSIK